MNETKESKNWIATIVCNGYEMTKAAIESFFVQDVGGILVYVHENGHDSGSARAVTEVLNAERGEPFISEQASNKRSVADVWNSMIKNALDHADHVLVCNNDIELHPSTYRLLLADGGDFVTPVGTSDRKSVMGDDVSESDFRPEEKRPHPVFSCFLIRRAAWEATGPFDERFVGAYCEDGDYHLRMHLAGVESHCISVPFYHRVSGTIANDLAGAAEIHKKADANRIRFKEKWGFSQGSPEYYEVFKTKVSAG